MVFSANHLSEWKDFPKGLSVLLLDHDTDSAAQIQSNLQAMDYIVSVFCNEDEALAAILNEPDRFHVAIVEVTTCDNNENLKFLETAAKDLPTIMTSNVNCLSIMMKCIALGAVEFLHKPLSEDKLRNIWQHVVHKAFNSGTDTILDSLKPVKESIVSMLHLSLDSNEENKESSRDVENGSLAPKVENEHSEGSDKYPAPPTPQLMQGSRLMDDADCHDNTNCSMEKEGVEQDEESKFVETTCDNSVVAEVIKQENNTQMTEDILTTEEHDSSDGSKSEGDKCDHPNDKETPEDSKVVNDKKTSASSLRKTNKNSKKKMKVVKVDWNTDLHKKFVNAVEQLGMEQAIPSKILELMNVDGLTRHNVASHLQKYRLHNKPILPKENDCTRWPQSRDQMGRSYYHHKPIMAYPPPPPPYPPPATPQVYPVWGAPNARPPVWTHPWQHHWNHCPRADSWGSPVMYPPPPPHPHAQYHHSYPQNTTGGYYNHVPVDNSHIMPPLIEYFPPDELIDNLISEAMNMGEQPLRLKPPSTDTVLDELSRKGIYSSIHGPV